MGRRPRQRGMACVEPKMKRPPDVPSSLGHCHIRFWFCWALFGYTRIACRPRAAAPRRACAGRL